MLPKQSVANSMCLQRKVCVCTHASITPPAQSQCVVCVPCAWWTRSSMWVQVALFFMLSAVFVYLWMLCLCMHPYKREDETKVKEVYKRNSVIKRHLALSVCERERTRQRAREREILRERERERAECSCLPPAPGTALHPTSCTAALLISVRLYEFGPQTESSKASFSPRVDGKTTSSVSLENRVHSAPCVLALK